MLAGSLLLGAGFFAHPQALPLDLDLKLGRQSYRSDSLNADAFAWSGRLQSSRLKFGGLNAGLSLSAGQDLYDRLLSGKLNLGGGGEAWRTSLDLSMTHREPGEMSVPLLYFDPEQLLIIEEREQSSLSVATRARFDWFHELFDMRLNLGATNLSHPKPDSIVTDRGSLALESELSFFLPSSIHLDLLADFGLERHDQRSSSDRRKAEWGLRLSRFVGENWSLRAEALTGRQTVSELSGISSYERPGGGTWKLDLAADRYATNSDLSLKAEFERENWDAYEGYYRSGGAWLGEALFARRFGEQVRTEILALLSAFDPDSSSAETWTLDRGRERRFEWNVLCGFRQDGAMPVELGFFGEETRLGAVQEDRFRILQAWLKLSWKGTEALRLSARLSLDEYLSRYQDEESQGDLGMSGWMELRWRRSPEWTLVAETGRSRRYSFLEGGDLIEDWQFSVGMERRAASGFVW